MSNLNSKIERHRLVFKGRVQGVGFRYIIQSIANKKNLTGWVKNLSNDDVEVEIQGPLFYIKYVKSYMSHESPWIKIIKIEDKEINIKKSERSFSVLY